MSDSLQPSKQTKELEMMVFEIKLGTERVYSKLEQLNDNLGKLEGSLGKMDSLIENYIFLL